MKCNCKATNVVLIAIVLVFALWESTISWLPSKWVIIVAAVLLLVHQLCCKKGSCDAEDAKEKKK